LSNQLIGLSMLSFWQKTSGTWINVFTILLGTAIGLILRGKMPVRIQQVLTQGLGLFTFFLGITMAGAMRNANAGSIDGTILGLLAIVLGGILGELLHIETHLTHLGDWLKHKFKGGGKFTEGFVATSLLFCIGPMANSWLFKQRAKRRSWHPHCQISHGRTRLDRLHQHLWHGCRIFQPNDFNLPRQSLPHCQ
jgi:hypothetical protein